MLQAGKELRIPLILEMMNPDRVDTMLVAFPRISNLYTIRERILITPYASEF